MYRLSVTTIEAFRRYITNASAYDTEEALIAKIKGEFKGNDKTTVGSCYGKIIEGDALVVEGGLLPESDGVKIFFTDEQALPAVEFRREHPSMIYEVPVQKVYETKYGPFLVSGRTDGIEGRDVNDNKCKFGTPDFRAYADSYQWRYYLDMLGLSTFFYDVYEVKGFEALKGVSPYQLPGVAFKSYPRLHCSRYNGLSDDCRLMLQDFVEYLEMRRLWAFLKRAAEPVLL